MEASCARSGRSPESVKLLAVTKTWPAELIERAAAIGLRLFGENYVQEALAKFEALPQELLEQLEFHFIGHLQRNKVKYVLGRFALFQAVDSLRLAEALEKRAAAKEMKVKVLFEVNLAGEASKEGFAPEELQSLVPQLKALEHLEPCGLMTMPPLVDDPETLRPLFAACRNLLETLRVEFGEGFKELSMGTSGDYPVAIEEGATYIRLGTALFGPRLYCTRGDGA